jgi:hypothetical protein
MPTAAGAKSASAWLQARLPIDEAYTSLMDQGALLKLG